MAGGLNMVQIIGNVGRDPEIRSFQNGGKVCNLTIATSESWKDKQSGEKKERTEWHRIAIFGPLAGIAEQYVTKGCKLYVCGKLQTRKWQDQQGNDRYQTEIVLQGFDAKMEILSRPNGSGWGGGDRGGSYSSGSSRGGGDDWGSGGSSGGSSGGFGGGQSRGGGFGGGGFGDDLDDDIPF